VTFPKRTHDVGEDEEVKNIGFLIVSREGGGRIGGNHSQTSYRFRDVDAQHGKAGGRERRGCLPSDDETGKPGFRGFSPKTKKRNHGKQGLIGDSHTRAQKNQKTVTKKKTTNKKKKKKKSNPIQPRRRGKALLTEIQAALEGTTMLHGS